MTNDARNDRATVGALGASVLAVGCCAGIPLAAGAIAAIGGVAFGSVVVALVLMIGAGVVVIRRRRHACPPSAPNEPVR